MDTITQNQGTITDYAQETYLYPWIRSFLVDRKAQGVSIGTLEFYQKKLKLFIDYCSNKSISQITQITPNQLRLYLLYLEDKGHNPGGVHAAYRAIRAFLNWWEEEYEPEEWKNPINKVRGPKVPIDPIQGIDIHDFQKLVGVCENKTFHGERDRAILFTLIDTGIRASELVSLNLNDFDYTVGNILIRQGKGRKPRTVFAGRVTRKQIRKWIRKRGTLPGALFTVKSGDRLTYWGLRQIIRRLGEKAGIDNHGLHDFRRTFALQSLRNGVDLQTISRLMGHSNLQVLTRYLKQTNEDLENSYKSPLDYGNF